MSLQGVLAVAGAGLLLLSIMGLALAAWLHGGTPTWSYESRIDSHARRAAVVVSGAAASIEMAPGGFSAVEAVGRGWGCYSSASLNDSTLVIRVEQGRGMPLGINLCSRLRANITLPGTLEDLRIVASASTLNMMNISAGRVIIIVNAGKVRSVLAASDVRLEVNAGKAQATVKPLGGNARFHVVVNAGEALLVILGDASVDVHENAGQVDVSGCSSGEPAGPASVEAIANAGKITIRCQNPLAALTANE